MSRIRASQSLGLATDLCRGAASWQALLPGRRPVGVFTRGSLCAREARCCVFGRSDQLRRRTTTLLRRNV